MERNLIQLVLFRVILLSRDKKNRHYSQSLLLKQVLKMLMGMDRLKNKEMNYQEFSS